MPSEGVEARAGTRERKDAAHDERREGGEATATDPLDPATRRAAQLAPPLQPLTPPAPTSAAAAPAARLSMEELLPQLVRRIAWGGDRKKKTVVLELGAGRHAGTTVTVHAEDGRLRLELSGGDAADALRSRLESRLRRRGLEVES